MNNKERMEAFKNLENEGCLGFVIKAVSNLGNVSFYSIERGEGYSYWGHISRAQYFLTADEALEVINSKEFKEPRRMSDGNMWPSRDLHTAAEANKANPRASVTISIVPIMYGPVTYIDTIAVTIPV